MVFITSGRNRQGELAMLPISIKDHKKYKRFQSEQLHIYTFTEMLNYFSRCRFVKYVVGRNNFNDKRDEMKILKKVTIKRNPEKSS